MNTDIVAAIKAHPSRDATEIAKDVSKKFDKFIPTAQVAKILADAERASNVGRVKGKASETLDSKLDVMEHVGGKLLAHFNDEKLPLKDRIEAAKELRQWTKMNLDLSGIHDEDSDTVFVIDSEWSPRPSGETN